MLDSSCDSFSLMAEWTLSIACLMLVRSAWKNKNHHNCRASPPFSIGLRMSQLYTCNCNSMISGIHPCLFGKVECCCRIYQVDEYLPGTLLQQESCSAHYVSESFSMRHCLFALTLDVVAAVPSPQPPRAARVRKPL
jgi:hypothetical protein